jgi:formiminotetrahydrofolate cyclodeaminase
VESLGSYLERLASIDAVPGGGSAAAVAGELAAALVAMVGRIRAVPVEGLVGDADRLRGELNDARLRDEAAYAGVVEAQALPKGDDLQRMARAEALEAALHRAAQAPLDVAALALAVLRLVDRLLATPLGALASDVGCAAEFAHASLAAAAYNVRINHRYMHDEPFIREQAERLAAYENAAGVILARARETFAVKD